MKKDLFYKIRPIEDKAYCVVRPEELEQSIKDWLYGMDDGQELVISQVKMTEKQFDAMPEYEG